MTSKTASLLTHAQPHCHLVYPSTDEHKLDEAVAVFADAGIRRGDAVVLVTTAERRAFIQTCLRENGHELDDLLSAGRLTFLEAGSLLSTFLRSGTPDPATFRETVGGIVEQASVDPTTGGTRNVRIFGEMVSLLFRASNESAAELLEQLWNELVESYSVALFCAYSLRVEDMLPQAIIDAHSHSIN